MSMKETESLNIVLKIIFGVFRWNCSHCDPMINYDKAEIHAYFVIYRWFCFPIIVAFFVRMRLTSRNLRDNDLR